MAPTQVPTRHGGGRARLMLAGLPSTVNASKYGARLMDFVKGEAEALLEMVEVEDIIKEGGELAILDEKYLPQFSRPTTRGASGVLL